MDGVSHMLEALDETKCDTLRGPALEELTAKIDVVGLGLHHMIGGREHRRRDCQNRLLGAAPGPKPMELRMSVSCRGVLPPEAGTVRAPSRSAP